VIEHSDETQATSDGREPEEWLPPRSPHTSSTTRGSRSHRAVNRLTLVLIVIAAIWLYLRVQEDERRAVALADYGLCWSPDCKARVSEELGRRLRGY
jgi:hypothetical protein